MNNFGKALTNGLVRENPTFRIVLGLCPTLAITTAAENGFWMGLAVIFVLVGSNVMVSALRGITPSKIRIPIFVLLIGTFVTIVDLVMHAYMPDMYKILGIYIPLIVVNCIIIARSEAFAYKNTVLLSLADGIGMGLGFTIAVMLIGAIREFLGTGNIVLFGRALLGAGGAGFEPAIIAILPSGALLIFGLLLAALNWVQSRGSRQGGVNS
jgi:electron transport complex protein RnfE